MNIYEKLIEVRKSCEYLKKDNQGYQFKFVSSAQTLGTLRGAMDAQGLLLVPSVTGNEVRDHTTKKGNHEYFTILNMSFRWVNAEKPEEFIDCPWIGQGLDDGEKGIGKALTYAEKYFLLKFFNIATDKDDPDAHQSKTSTDAPPKQQSASQPATGSTISEAQGKRLFAICKESGTTIADCANKFGFKKAGDIAKSQYKEICEWAEVGSKEEMVQEVFEETKQASLANLKKDEWQQGDDDIPI